MRRKLFLVLCASLLAIMLTGCSSGSQLPDEPVRPIITVEGFNIDYIAAHYCWFGSQTDGVCSDPPEPTAYNKMIRDKAIKAIWSDTISVKFPIHPDEFTLTMYTDDGQQVLLGKPNQFRYSLPMEPGYYRYRLSAVWAERNTVDYDFGIQTSDTFN
ncbi:hypothetical protein [Paenibacillus sp. CF384]|uniref:hypothetical protein n=1 Tax=Paenibacillus sp. CF384 TaxID=1884382 RepID=UPI00089B2FB9|nr:hypothetical protein [Paenibacillus sp. CF384]SDX08303.1 hypothetical protein SAMN05518855_1008212 [Paenibacillus sp. CF384]